jgi:GTP-binding protein EngB required for normal cell division
MGFLAQRPGLTVIVAATKLDKLPRAQQKPALARLTGHPPKEGVSKNGLRVVGTSAETREGRDVLWSRLLAAARGT